MFQIQTSSAPSTMDNSILELEMGRLVGIPTETVYGLAGDATSEIAVQKIFTTKNRPATNPLICHISTVGMGKEIARLDERALALTKTYWPGSLTLVLPRNKKYPLAPSVYAMQETIAIRCPNNEFTRNLISGFGAPLAAPSANKSGQLSSTSAKQVASHFSKEELQLIADDGVCEVGVESTIVLCLPDQPLKILRHGSILLSSIQKFESLKFLHEEGTSNVNFETPGSQKSHYAPKAGVVMLQSFDELPDSAQCLLDFGQQVGSSSQLKYYLDLSQLANLDEAAHNLFDYLYKLDQSQPDTIFVSPVPAVGIGVAINDRLRRAAAARSVN